MKTYLAAVAIAATLAQPAAAITFPSLTTIYVGAGVSDSGGANFIGASTIVLCSNVSGTLATVRVLMLNAVGAIEGQATVQVGHGQTAPFYTHVTSMYGATDLQTGQFVGVVNIESTQSGVFCTAQTVDASLETPVGVTLPLVRVNPHPGTVE